MNRKPIITLTTDFGLKDEYVGSLKAAILRVNPEIIIVDITHQITPYSILEGAFILASCAPQYPKAVHLAVVDPGVGSERKALILKTNLGHFLIGPDNGLLIPASERLGGIAQAFEILPEKFIYHKISSTFHGRDIFAPASALIAGGVSPEELGKKVDPFSLAPSPFFAEFEGSVIKTVVANTDNFGSVRFPVLFKDLLNRFPNLTHLKLKSPPFKEKIRYAEYFASVGKGELFFYEDSSGYLAIGANCENAGKILKLFLAQKVEIEAVEEK